MAADVYMFKQGALDFIDERREDLAQLCCDLVKIPSENPPGDTGKVASFALKWLKERGVEASLFKLVDEKPNIIANLGVKEAPTLILNGHLDVVPAGDLDRWSFHPFAGDVQGGFIRGRGSVDMKGGCAALMMAFHTINKLIPKLPGKLTLSLVSDEETGGPHGVRGLMERGLLHGDLCIIAEPSGFKDVGYTLVIGERGALWLKVKAYGKQAHGSMPMLGENAILKAFKAIEKIYEVRNIQVSPPPTLREVIEDSLLVYRRMEVGRRLQKDELSKVLNHYTVNIGKILGGAKVNIVPDHCEVEVDIRAPPGGSTKDIESLVSEAINSLRLKGVEYDVFNRVEPSFTPKSNSIIKVLKDNGRKLLGYEPPTYIMPATSDAARFRGASIPTVSIGPGLIEDAHTFNESVAVDDVIKASKLYAASIIDFFT